MADLAVVDEVVLADLLPAVAGVRVCSAVGAVGVAADLALAGKEATAARVLSAVKPAPIGKVALVDKVGLADPLVAAMAGLACRVVEVVAAGVDLALGVEEAMAARVR